MTGVAAADALGRLRPLPFRVFVGRWFGARCALFGNFCLFTVGAVCIGGVGCCMDGECFEELFDAAGAGTLATGGGPETGLSGIGTAAAGSSAACFAFLRLASIRSRKDKGDDVAGVTAAAAAAAGAVGADGSVMDSGLPVFSSSLMDARGCLSVRFCSSSVSL